MNYYVVKNNPTPVAPYNTPEKAATNIQAALTEFINNGTEESIINVASGDYGTTTFSGIIHYNLTIQGASDLTTILTPFTPIDLQADIGIIYRLTRFTFVRGWYWCINNYCKSYIYKNIFKQDSAIDYGNGIKNFNGSDGSIIKNNTFYDNIIAINTQLTFTGTIITFNNIFYNSITGIGTSLLCQAGEISSTHNCFYNQTNYSGNVTDKTYDLADTNPLFVSVGSDFNLTSDSPCINAGVGNVDMGAYANYNLNIQKDLVKGRLLFYNETTIIATVNRSGWHNGDNDDSGGECKGININFDRTNGWFEVSIIELNDSETVCGYIISRRGES